MRTDLFGGESPEDHVARTSSSAIIASSSGAASALDRLARGILTGGLQVRGERAA